MEGGLRGGADDRPREAAKLSLLGHGVAGTLAGQTVCLIITPIELLKGASRVSVFVECDEVDGRTAKLQMQTHSAVKQFSGPVDCAKQIVQVQGVRGLWHAFPATLLFRGALASLICRYTYKVSAQPGSVRCASPPTSVLPSSSMTPHRFATYEVLMRQFRSANLSAGTSNFLSGGLSSTVFWTGSFAFDAVKKCVSSSFL